jgi:hypothetical protein
MTLRLKGLYENFTGDFGVLSFVNGLSTTEVTAIIGRRMGAIVTCETERGDNPLDPNVDWEGVGVLESVPPEYSRMWTVADQERMAAAANPETPVVAPAPAWTREMLEAIADKQGIAGLREISDPLGLKGTSIRKLIEEILSGKVVVDDTMPNQDVETKV